MGRNSLAKAVGLLDFGMGTILTSLRQSGIKGQPNYLVIREVNAATWGHSMMAQKI